MGERYQVPPIEFVPKRSWDIPMSGTVPGFSQATIVSGKITFPFRITRVRMWFRNDAAYSVLLYWLVSPNSTGSTTGIPSGDNIFAYAAPVPYFAAEDTVIEALSNYEDPDGNKYLKLHAVNGLAVLMDVLGIATVEEL